MAENLPIDRMIASGTAWWRLCWQVTETMAASQSVIATRMAMMGAGIGQPHRMPHAEMARLVPEKMAAFGKAGSDAARQLAAAGTTLPAAMAFDAAASLELIERWLAVSAAWWQPVHRQATSNARRLGRRRG